ncbi:class I SAM-dependent methyltransferase [Terricaulis silvestris]|uniref:Macrocin O-methyltransferase n=1 Tax=Terricaulis silvestris TaxID=2686094 RepID=A0A6I6MZI4_9CAUL|nr:TylF/MycF/NovP-related O-methyltransferase [Terricaulis silvestris]QGZ96533.1 Macrocin O-methyltransferase [Terricaulis silvestris]
MNYLDALKQIHAAVRPDFYVEIGCLAGASLELADCPRLGIDPEPKITGALTQPTRLYRQTSDAFFARSDVDAIFGQKPDLAFIDGMHLAEFALRDFINLETHAAPHSLIVIDDVAPGDILWAERERQSQAWTGDVYRMIPILREYRPDLEIAVFDATILDFDKGIAVIGNLDPGNIVLRDAYAEIEERIKTGQWTAETTDGIRELLKVAPAEALAPYVAAHVAAHPSPRRTGPLLRYLELIKCSILNEIYLEDEFRLLYLRECLEGKAKYDPATYLDLRAAYPQRYAAFEAARNEGLLFERSLSNLGFAQSMMGRKRMENLHDCLEQIRKNDIPGDVIECGVWRGGGCIFMAAYLQAHGMTSRKVLVADSFRGLPVSSRPEDSNLDLSRGKAPELAISRAIVERNFNAYGLLSGNVVFIEGWFRDTLASAPCDQLALLRLDGDFYESTMDALTALYDRVAPGGAVIIDDYYAVPACANAVKDFFAARGEAIPEAIRIDWTGISFTKPDKE